MFCYSSFLICLLLLHICIGSSPRNIIFTHIPEDVYPVPKQQISLKCRAKGTQPISISWLKDGKVVETQRDKPATSNLINRPGELLFLSFSPSDAGKYSCNASNVYGWIESPSALVQTAYFNSSTARGPKNKVVSVGEPLIMECIPPAGLPKPIIKWKRNGESILDDTRFSMQNDGTLQINSVKLIDGGNYQCVAENTAGDWSSKSALLTVQLKPKFKYAPSNKQVFVGDSVEFGCLASDNVHSSVLWTREGNSVPRASLLDQRSLRIENVQLGDAGNYICQVKNSVGHVESVAHLTVISPPTFLVTPTDQTVFAGSSAILDCLTEGSPKPMVRWIYKHKSYWVPEMYGVSEYAGGVHVFSNGTLVINSVVPGDAGLYECKVSQQAETKKSSATLYVDQSLTSLIPVVDLGPQNQTVVKGSKLTLQCKGSVVHYHAQILRELFNELLYNVTVHWIINGVRVERLNDSRVAILPSGSLQITSVRPSDGGQYTCEVRLQSLFGVKSAFHSTRWMAFIKVIEDVSLLSQSDFSLLPENYDVLLPEPLHHISVLSVGDTWVTLDIKSSKSNKSSSSLLAPLVNFRVEFAEYNGSKGWTIMVLPISHSVEIFGLKPRTGYYILVRGVNKLGAGKPSILRQIVYTTDIIPAFRKNSDVVAKLETIDINAIRARALSPSEAIIDWTVCAPGDNAAFVTEYKTTVDPLPLSHCVHLNPSNEGYFINFGLMPDMNRRCPYIPAAELVHLEDMNVQEPCSLSNIIQTSKLDWSPPSSFKKEKVEHAMYLQSDRQGVMRMIISDLKPFICYSLKVQPLITHHEHGQYAGKISSSSLTLTFGDKPIGSPKVHGVKWRKNNTVLEIYWYPPSNWDIGGILTGYTMRIFPSGSTSSRKYLLGPEQSSRQLDNLYPQHNYTIYIAAVNCRGEGVRSFPIYVFTYPSESDRHQHPVSSLSDSEIGNSQNKLSSMFSRKVLYDDGKTVFTQDPYSNANEEDQLIRSLHETANFLHEPLFIVLVIIFSIIWIFVIIGLILYGRRRSKRDRRRTTTDKNGRLCSSSDSYLLSQARPSAMHCTIPTALGQDFSSTAGQAFSHPSYAVTAYDPTHNGAVQGFDRQDKLMFGNGYMGHINQPNGFSSVGVHPNSSSSNGTVLNRLHYSPHYSGLQGSSLDAVKNSSYVTSQSIPMSTDNPCDQYFPMLSNGSHHSPDVILSRSNASNNSRAPIVRSDHPTNKSNGSMTDKDDTVTPYASVSVIQQMVFDRIDHPSVPHTNQSDRQLSFAEIIPPPPDYPPPAVPSSPPPADPQTPLIWQQHSSVSGDDSTYYAHSDLQRPPDSTGHQRQALVPESDLISSPHWTVGVPQAVQVVPGLEWSQQDSQLLLPSVLPHQVLLTSPEQKGIYAG